MNIKAKVTCASVESWTNGVDGPKEGENVTFQAVYSEDKTSENYSFSQATPSLSLSMNISNPGAFGAFEKGKEYFLTFEPATNVASVS